MIIGYPVTSGLVRRVPSEHSDLSMVLVPFSQFSQTASVILILGGDMHRL